MKIGDTYTFTPSALASTYEEGHLIRPKVTGTVVYIHKEHSWFMVRFPLGDYAEHCECFKMYGDDTPSPAPSSPVRHGRHYKRSFDGGRRALGQVYKNT